MCFFLGNLYLQLRCHPHRACIDMAQTISPYVRPYICPYICLSIHAQPLSGSRTAEPIFMQFDAGNFTGNFRDISIVVKPEQILRRFIWTLHCYQGEFSICRSHDAKRKKVTVALRLKEQFSYEYSAILKREF